MLWRRETATVRLCEITATRPDRTSDISLTCQTLPCRAPNVAKSKFWGQLHDITSSLISSSHSVLFSCLFQSFIFRSSEVHIISHHVSYIRSSISHPSTLRHLAKGILCPKAALIVKTFNAKGSSGHQTTWSIRHMKIDLVKINFQGSL